MTLASPAARILNMAAASLAARGAAVPIHWHGGAVVEVERPAELVSVAARRLQQPEAAAAEPQQAMTPARRRAAVQRAAERVVARLGAELPSSGEASARDVYRALVEIALDQALQRGYRAAPSQITYMIGTETAAWAFGVSQPTMWRRLDVLRRAGLVDTRRWYTRVKGEGRTAGTLVSVRLMAGTAKVHHDALAGDWRDLENDIKTGRTWRQRRLNALSTPQGTHGAIQYLKTIALPPRDSVAPVNLMHSSPAEATGGADLAELFDLPGVDRSERARRVDALAGALAGRLRDSKSRDLYRWLIWQALRLADQGQMQYLGIIHDTARRVLHDAGDSERVLRKPGARLVAILRGNGVWDALKSAPATRVGALAVAA